MKTMFQHMADELSAGKDLVLVFTVASSGATPRGAGAWMLMGRQGRIWGTIGGGAVEYRSEQIAQTVFDEKKSFGHDFTLTKEDVQNLGMICGGDVRVFFHYVPAGDPATLSLAKDALKFFSQGEPLWFISDIGNGGMLNLFTPKCGFSNIDAPDWLAENLTRHPRRICRDGRELYVEQINDSGRVYVFGGGHVAQELVPVLSHVGFRCVVMDDRPEFADPALFPTAEEVVLGDFRHIANYVTIGAEDYVCVMTRGHAYDTVVQAQILQCRPCYVGVIGSAHKAAGVRQVLREEYGVTDAELDLVTTPIGLPIKAETPAEIAISIAAQMILHRAERSGL